MEGLAIYELTRVCSPKHTFPRHGVQDKFRLTRQNKGSPMKIIGVKEISNWGKEIA